MSITRRGLDFDVLEFPSYGGRLCLAATIMLSRAPSGGSHRQPAAIDDDRLCTLVMIGVRPDPEC